MTRNECISRANVPERSASHIPWCVLHGAKRILIQHLVFAT